ncbi:MAG: hypothetical protein MUC67_00740 [Acidobacteria bacterium]|nr:hypothetical protein [Acidobacteriota bacterium]
MTVRDIGRAVLAGCVALALALAALAPAEAAKKSRSSAKRKKPAATAPLPKIPDVAPPLLEAAGPGELVRGVVVPGTRLAGVVVWPGHETLEGPGVPAGSALVAAHLAVLAATAAEPGAAPLVALVPEGIAVGARLDGGDEARLARLLSALAAPRPLPDAARDRATVELQRKASEHWADPATVARRAALGLLYPGSRFAWDPMPTPQAVNEADAGARAAVFAAVREARVRYLVAGPAGLAGRLSGALPARGGSAPPAVEAPVPAPHAPLAALIDEYDAPGAPGKVGLVLGYALDESEVPATQRAALAVLAEGLSEGEGSLVQRLKVVLGQAAPAQAAILRGAGDDEVLLLSALVPAPSAALAWRVMTGAITSVQTIALRDDAVYRARRRLAEEATARRADPVAALLDAFGGGPTRFGPQPVLAPADLQAAARQALVPGRRASVAAGPLIDELARAAEFEPSLRLAWERFDPLSETLMQSGDAAERDAAAAQDLARAALSALADGATPAFDPRYRATYHVREETPAGPVDSTLRIVASPEGIGWTVDAPDWTIEAEERPEKRTSPADGVIHLPQPNRLLGLVLREPAILLASVVDGSVAAEAVRASCDGTLCPALRAELEDGSVLTLVLDDATRMPRSLRTWWPGKDESRAPDEQVRYLAWRRVGTVRVAEQVSVEDALGTTRRVSLDEWIWP